jgi:hypothetical protein
VIPTLRRPKLVLRAVASVLNLKTAVDLCAAKFRCVHSTC